MRDTVPRLVHEGLLVRLPRRGIMVKTLSIEEIRDLYEVRETLELMAVRRAVDAMDEASVLVLRDLLKQGEALAVRRSSMTALSGHRINQTAAEIGLANKGEM